MSQKNETTILIVSLLITSALIGVGIWFFNPFAKNPSSRDSNITNNSTSSPANPSNLNSDSNNTTFAQVQKVPNGLFSYGGSTSWATIRGQVDPAIQIVWPQFKLRYTHPNSGSANSSAGIRMLLDNQLSFAQSSRPLNDKEYQQAQQRGFTLKEIPVAIDGRAVGVHPSLNIKGLTVAQVEAIESGKITNWQEVGGPNLRIKRYAIQGEDTNNVEFLPSPTAAMAKVASDPGGVILASAALIVNQCKIKPLPIGRTAQEFIPPYKEPLIPIDQCSTTKRNQVNTDVFQSGTYPLTRRLFVVVKQNGLIDQQAGEVYANLLLTNQGQEIIDKSGFVRIR